MRDALTRVIALAALFVSLCSLAISILTYRRGGARISIETGYAKINHTDRSFWLDGLRVAITNKGLASAQITNIDFQVQPYPHLKIRPSDLYGPELPHKLDGHHSEVWQFPFILLARFDPDRIFGKQVTCAVELGSGKKIERKAWVITRKTLALIAADREKLQRLAAAQKSSEAVTPIAQPATSEEPGDAEEGVTSD